MFLLNEEQRKANIRAVFRWQALYSGTSSQIIAAVLRQMMNIKPTNCAF